MKLLGLHSRIAVSLCSALLGGCGGGGGSTGSGGASFTPSATSIQVQASITAATGPSATISVSVQNPPSSSYYIGGRYTTNGIAMVVENYPSGGPPGYQIQFRAPYTLAPGTYTDTLRLQLCVDSACTLPLTPSQDVAVTYQVNPAGIGQEPTATLSASQVTFRAFLTDYPNLLPKVAPITITYVNVPALPSVTVSSTHNGIDSVFYEPSGSNSATITIYFKNPAGVGPGTYSDTIQIMACLDSNCVNSISPAPAISATYTVTNTVPGTNGYTINEFPINASDIAWDSVHNQLLVAMPASSSVQASTIARLDPLTGQLSSPTSIAGTPRIMAISADASYLYVGLTDKSIVQRYSLPNMTPDIQIPLPNDPPTYAFLAGTIDIAPDNAHTVAVTLDDSGSPFGLVIFDDAVARPDTFGTITMPYNPVTSARWGANGTMLFGSDSNFVSSPDLYRFDVNAMGVQLQTHVTDAPRGELHFAQNLLYADSGAIIDPTTLLVTGSFAAPPSNQFMIPDPALNRAFFVNGASVGSSGGSQIVSYDLTTQVAIASLPLPHQIILTRHLVRWGANGLAFIDALNNQIVVIYGGFVAP